MSKGEKHRMAHGSSGLGKGLGKGLDALIRDTGSESSKETPTELRVDDIQPNPEQPRRSFCEKEMAELAQSIETLGLLQPILVKPVGESAPGKYSIIAGERRWRASQKAGLKSVPVVVRNFTALETAIASLVENLQREDLNPMEEAAGISMLKEEFDMSQDELARKLGKSRSAIANSLRLLALSASIQNDVVDGKLTAGHARALLGITDGMAQQQLRDSIVKTGCSVREAEGMVALWKETGAFVATRPASGDEETVDGALAHQGMGNLETQAKNKKTRSSRAGRSQSAKLLAVQQSLESTLGAPIRVTGNEHSGKISISYTSNEELQALLVRFGTSQKA